MGEDRDGVGTVGTVETVGAVIGPSEEHRTVHGSALAIRRTGLRDYEGKPVTQAMFAALCGHSESFQCQIERPGKHEVLRGKAEQIESALAYFEKLTQPQITRITQIAGE
jgi:hypothetical protein